MAWSEIIVNNNHRFTIDKNGCWIWNLSTTPAGYGVICSGYRRDAVHRIFYVSIYGKIPDGLDLDHLCRVRRCCNPAHLEAVTRQENARRGARTKLTQEKADKIREEYNHPKIDQYMLAEKYGVSDSTISDIITNRRWVKTTHLEIKNEL